jgi:hypothetical protein
MQITFMNSETGANQLLAGTGWVGVRISGRVLFAVGKAGETILATFEKHEWWIGEYMVMEPEDIGPYTDIHIAPMGVE